jgi:hypothetical protein
MTTEPKMNVPGRFLVLLIAYVAGMTFTGFVPGFVYGFCAMLFCVFLWHRL